MSTPSDQTPLVRWGILVMQAAAVRDAAVAARQDGRLMPPQITVMRSLGPLLTKRIALGGNGKPVSDGSACRMQAGTAVTIPAPDAATLASKIDALSPAEAVVLGSIKGAANGQLLNVVTADALAKIDAPQRNGTIARTRDHIDFPPGEPAWMLLDSDVKGAPTPVTSALAVAGGVFPALLTVAPGLERAARVTRASTSTGLFNSTTNERFDGSGGEHCYVLVINGADIDRATRAFHARAWLHGFGWMMLGAVGQVLSRGLIDASVRYPERLCFEGPPEIVPPLAQDTALRACRVTEGEAIDTRVMIPDLTASERQQVEDAKAAMRRALELQALTVRAAVDNKLAEDIVRREGVPFATALRRVAAWRRGVLNPCIKLITDHHGTILVRDILLDPQRYVGVTLCDPHEGVSYGYCKAMIMASQREPGRVFIHSFAHGGGTYDLRHDVHSAEAALQSAPVEGIADTLCNVVDSSDLEAEEVQTLIELAAERGNLKRMMLRRRVKADQERRAKFRRQEAITVHRAENPLDQRVRRPVPPSDGELTPVITDLDRVLSEDDSERPPMRKPYGTLVELRVEVPFDLHQLAATGSNALESDNSTQVPAPAEPLLVDMTPVDVEVMIERYFVFEKTTKDGNSYYAALPAAHIKAFMAMPGSVSRLPHVNAVNTAPMVAENGAFIAGDGLDRDSGIFHFIDPALRDCLPKGDITEETVRKAVQWLFDEWLVDVLTDEAGKLVAISVALSMIERLLLEIRPAFLISAGLRGGGKTTLAHMLTMAVHGRMASAASWSPHQEERRKCLFAHFRQGVAGLVWDNIANGAEISCPEVEKSLTSPTIQDRILGVSQGAIAPTNTIQIFVGNNIKFAGDMASRGAEIRLTTDDPNPEDRAVQHADPIGWTRDHRAEVLKHLYTVLTYGCRNRPPGQVEKTRFRKWWSLVGWPVELAASLIGQELDFPAIFKATEAQDSKAAGIVSALILLRATFGDGDAHWFRSRDIRDILDEGGRARERARMSSSRHATDEATIKKARDFLEIVAELEGKAYANPVSHIIGRALARIVDRTVNLNDTTRGVLRSRLLHGNAEFRIEVRHKGEDGEYFSNQRAHRPWGGSTSPPIHPEEANFDDQVAQGGSSGPPGGRSAPENQKYSPIQPKPKKQQRRNKAAEKTQPRGEDLDETW
jgi:hypothetical protein